MGFYIRKSEEKDAFAIGSIFNHYIKTGTAAFLLDPVDPKAFYGWLKKFSYNDAIYVAEDAGKIAGFGVLKQYNDKAVFKNTAEPGYFFLPEFTGKGAGTALFLEMESDAKKLGIKNLLVSISSRNTGSIKFHEKHGFKRAGEFKGIGFKLGSEFDVVWMQKKI